MWIYGYSETWIKEENIVPTFKELPIRWGYVCVYQMQVGVRDRGSWGGEGQGKCLDEYINSHSLPKKCKVPQGSREEKGYVWLRKFRAAFWSSICLLPTSLRIITPMTFLHNVFFLEVLTNNLFQPFPFLTTAPTWPFFHLQHLADLLSLLPAILLKTSNNHVANVVVCYYPLQTHLPT